MNIDLSKLTGKLLEIAKQADANAIGENSKNNKYLDSDEEISLFLKDAKVALDNGEVEVDDVKAVFGYTKNPQGLLTDMPKAITQDDTDAKFTENIMFKLPNIKDRDTLEQIYAETYFKFEDEKEKAEEEFSQDVAVLDHMYQSI